MPYLNEKFGHYCPNMCIYVGPSPIIVVTCPKVIEAMYTTHNKSFDKHDLVKLLTMELTGRSILFAESNPEWRARRKALSPAFYKGKLIKMIEIAKGSVQTSLKRLQGMTESGVKTKIDLIGEMSRMNIRIILERALGIDITEDMLPYWENGKLVQRDVPYVLRTCFQIMINRMFTCHVIMFPWLADKYITPAERDLLANSRTLRAKFQKVVNDRRQEMKEGRRLDEGDFLSILLSDELFKEDNEMIVDEILTFFFAGSQTSSVVTQNLLMHLMKESPIHKKKILDELEQVVIQPHLAKLVEDGKLKVGETVTNIRPLDVIDYEDFTEMSYYGLCVNEALRIQPPVSQSSTVCMMKDVDCGGLVLKKGDAISISMEHFGRNPAEWQEPKKFIPERFDS